MSTTSTARSTRRTQVQLAALVVGAVFLLVGVLGFVPGITTHYDDMTFAGHHSMAKLLGVFMVSVLHNIVHLLFGVAGIIAARTARNSRLYLIVGGVIYLVLWLYGLIDRPDERRELRAGQHRRQLAALRPRRRHDRPRGGADPPERHGTVSQRG